MLQSLRLFARELLKRRERQTAWRSDELAGHAELVERRARAPEGASVDLGVGRVCELNRIYAGSTVNLDLGRAFQADIVTMRVFDVLACGGFALVEHSAALEECFEVGVELASYRDVAELRAKVAHFLQHPDRARAIAERGRAAVVERHDMTARLAAMLGSAGVA